MDKFDKEAHKITQDYIESFGAQLLDIDELDKAIAAALRYGKGYEPEQSGVPVPITVTIKPVSETVTGDDFLWVPAGEGMTWTEISEEFSRQQPAPLSRKKALKKIRKVMRKWGDPSWHEYTFTDAQKDINDILERVNGAKP